MDVQDSLLLENPSLPNHSSHSKFKKVQPKSSLSSKKSGLNLLEDSKRKTFSSFNNPVLNKKKFRFFFSLPDNSEEILRIELHLSEEDTAETAIPSILVKFNEKFKEENVGYRFNTSKPNVFDLMMATKSGKPKDAMPSIDKYQMLSMTGMSNFALIDREESKKSVKRTKDLFSLESKETYWPSESVENEVFFRENQQRTESFMNAKRTYAANSLINIKEQHKNEAENNTHCLNYCKFSLCK